MGYKAIGYVIWRGGRWYLRRRFPGLSRKVVLAGTAGMLLAGAAAAASQRRSAAE